MTKENNETPTPIKKGGISVQTEHIFPVIKKWLYSEKEIFLRELVSNACDAVSKLTRLSSLGEITLPEEEKFSVIVRLDEEEKTLTVSDNGIGMTAEEVEKYIGNIALSGAADFIEKYEKGDNSSGIIGHFGLGFYSAFMVADEVEIITRSYTGAPTVHWTCSDTGEYTEKAAEEERERGTDIILHINEEGKEYLSRYKCREVLEKYCSFMPVEIFLEEAGKDSGTDAEKDGGDGDKDEPKAPVPINDTHPLWLKSPADCTEEEYRDFYRKVFHDFREPLFQIHISADYPLNFKGILYFPAIRNEYDSLEGQVKLYYNQVFVADNLKEVIPDYLLLLRGVLDCPELPLNVSRSYLQNSGYVSKISSHITKKVADKVVALFTNEREKYEGFWKDIRYFVEYGAIRDKKFYERVKSALLLKLTDGSHVSLDEYLEKAPDTAKDKVYYTSDKVLQAQYVKLFEDKGIAVAELAGPLDLQFISFLEAERKIKFLRIDSGTDALRAEGEKYENEELAALFRKISGNEKLTVKFESLSDKDVPALLNISEEDRRFADMMRMYGGDMPAGMGGAENAVLILNAESSLIRALGEKTASSFAETAAGQIWSLALLAQRQLSADELRAFLATSYGTLEKALDGEA